jgi:hypothetical protein
VPSWYVPCMQRDMPGPSKSRSKAPRFRTTVWPGVPVPVPPVTREVVQWWSEDEVFEFAGVVDQRPLDPEVVLRELPMLDASRPEALRAFMDQHGPLTAHGADCQVLLPHGHRVLSAPMTDPDAAPLAVVAHHVHVLQALVAHWEAAQQGDDTGVLAAWTTVAARRLRSLAVAWGYFRDHLNAALQPFHVAVHISDAQSREFDSVTAYSVMALTIANDIAVGATWRQCANEACQRLFARQQGRSEHGQHRSTGVIYCSRNCAKAQVERERRRRQRGERDGTQKGR